MKLLAKFSLMFIVVFGLGLAAAGYLSHALLQKNARKQIEDRATIMMETALAMRRYTTEKVKPAFGHILTAKPEVKNAVFFRETVPAFAATEMFAFLREKYPDYSYKEAAPVPTNLRNRTEDWEADIVNNFRDHPELTSFAGERMTPMGKSLFVARPMRATANCMECHSTPTAAPPEMLERYGSANGFGWKVGDVIAAQIVSVPEAIPVQMANQEFEQLMGLLLAVGGVTLLVLNLVLVLAVIRPVGQMATRAEEISEGKMEVPELPCSGKCEISMLAASFNRMHRSLVAAMKLLENP